MSLSPCIDAKGDDEYGYKNFILDWQAAIKCEKWTYTTSAMVLDEAEYHEKRFGMYRRYIKQWNDIKLIRDKSLSGHTHEVQGAEGIGGPGVCFILHWHNENNDHWILEINYTRSFSEFHSGLSCGRNPFLSRMDVLIAHLH